MSNGVVKLSNKSSILRGTMKINLAPLSKFEKFWQQDAENSDFWQFLAFEYINKPYLDVPSIMGGKYNITYRDFTVYHRNHDVTHAIRQKHYAEKYLRLIESYGNEKFAPVAKYVNQTSEIKACLKLAIYLCRSGRTNELSGKEDPSNAKRSAELFEQTALKLGFDHDLVAFLKFSIATHAPNLQKHQAIIDKLPGENKSELAHLLKGVIDLSHHTDLVRCKVGAPEEPVREQIDTEIKHFLDPSQINAERVTTNMLLHATEACKLTGTRVKFRLFSQQNETNTPELKVKYTKDVKACMHDLEDIKFDPHRIIHEGPESNFEESLRQAKLIGILNLSNQNISSEQSDKVIELIRTQKLTEVNLIGLIPESSKQTISQELEKIIVEQNLTIEVKKVISASEKLRVDFNHQFQQHAFAQPKSSMRFEPSRLGAAFKQGWKIFFSKLWKEMIGDVPKFGGSDHFTQIMEVRKLSNSTIETRFNEHIEEKGEYKDYLSGHLTEALQTIATDDVKLERGEMLLYHGVSPEVAPLIMAQGFDENRCKKTPVNGYGPLGKGIYFTSELSKAATFSTCTECKQAGTCSCVKPGTNEPAERVLLLCKVFVGNPEIIFTKGTVNQRSEPNQGFDSCIALSQDIEAKSDFRSVEVCVPKGSQVIPLYEIRFSSQPNLLNVEKWQERLSSNSLFLTHKKEAKQSIEYLKQLEELRKAPTNLAKLQHSIEKLSICLEQIETKEPSLNDIQKRDIANLKKQISTFSLNRQQIEESNKQKKISNQGLFSKLISGFQKKVASIVLNEYTLKLGMNSKAKKIVENMISSDQFISNLLQWIDYSIERDKSKGGILRWFLNREPPAHRSHIIQEMYKLQQDIINLRSRNLSTTELELALKSLFSETQARLDEYAKKEPAITKATTYKNMLLIKEATRNIVSDDAFVAIQQKPKFCHLTFLKRQASLFSKRPRIYIAKNPTNMKTSLEAETIDETKPFKDAYQQLRQVDKNSQDKSSNEEPSLTQQRLVP